MKYFADPAVGGRSAGQLQLSAMPDSATSAEEETSSSDAATEIERILAANDYYSILSVDRDATSHALRSSYKVLASTNVMCIKRSTS